MATISKGHTYSSGDEVTHTNLNKLVDSATVSAVAQADVESNSGLIVRSSSAPTDTDAGWYDTVGNVLKLHSGSGWVQVGTLLDALSGLEIANNATDAVNDIDIGVGSAMDSTNAQLINLPSAFTKKIDAEFAEGTNAGGRDSSDNLTGAKWFRVYLLGDTTANKAGDVFISTSDSPTEPTGWDVHRLIGYVRWDGSTIVAQKCVGSGPDKFIWYPDAISVLTKTGDSASSYTDVDLTSAIPPLGKWTTAAIQVWVNETDNNNWMFLRPNGSSSGGDDGRIAGLTISATSTSSVSVAMVMFPVDDSQLIEYHTHTASMNAKVYVYGYALAL